MRLIDADALIESMGLTDCRKGYKAEAYDTRMNYEVLLDIENAPTINNWIPVSERLPIPFDDVIVETSTGRVAVGWIDGFRKWWVCTDVIAWQPLPQGYEGDDNNGRNTDVQMYKRTRVRIQNLSRE